MTLSPAEARMLAAELVRWEMREACVYGAPITKQAAELKVSEGLRRVTPTPEKGA
jgi:hypothetical protein